MTRIGVKSGVKRAFLKRNWALSLSLRHLKVFMYHVYILLNDAKTRTYTGVVDDVNKRLAEHNLTQATLWWGLLFTFKEGNNEKALSI